MISKSTLKVSRNQDGKTAFWVGGGAKTKTFSATFVLRPTVNGQYRLPDPIFVRGTGTLANRTDQALVEINVNDIIITVEGTKPIVKDNPDITSDAVQVIGFHHGSDGYDYATIADYEVLITLDKIPKSAIEGMNRYHNRHGECFVHMQNNRAGGDPLETSEPVIVA
jgi:hypothetical protein